MTQVTSFEESSDLYGAAELLGGALTLEKSIRNRLDAHDMIKAGLPAGALDHLIRAVAVARVLNRQSVGDAIGMSPNFLRRINTGVIRFLSPEQGGRLWKFAEIFSRVAKLMGSKEAAEVWLTAPQMALDQRKPIDLLSTTAGVETVEEFITRLEFGVYT